MPAASALRAEKVIAERSRGAVFLPLFLIYHDMKRVLDTYFSLSRVRACVCLSPFFTSLEFR
jgi:hypothetical protein